MESYIKIIPNTWFGDDYIKGQANGYVVVPANHPFHGFPYDFVNQYVMVHGGLTYSGWEKNGHSGYCFGFDTAHLGDTSENWTVDAVYIEAVNLLKQFNVLAEEYTRKQLDAEYATWCRYSDPEYDSAGFTEEDR